MRIAVVSTYYPNAADPLRAVFIRNLTLAISKRASVHVISPIPYAPPLSGRADWSALRSVPRVDRRDDLEVSHPRFVVVPKCEALSGATYALSVLPVLRRLHRQHRLDVIHAHCAYPDGVGVSLAAEALNVPFVVTAHGSDVNVYGARRFIRPQLCRALRRASAAIAVSGEIHRKVASMVPSRASCIAQVPCAAVDPGVFMPRDRTWARQALGISDQGRLALSVGQLVPVKNPALLLEAWRRLLQQKHVGGPDRLCFIGEGPLRTELERAATASEFAGTVQFLGGRAQSEVALWFNAANVACLTSRSEGTPNVVIEALASGTPVAATAVGGVPDLIVPGVGGELVPAGDVEAYSAAMHRILTRNWDFEQVAVTVRGYTWETLAARNLTVLETAMGSGRAP